MTLRRSLAETIDVILDALIAALIRLPELAEVEAAELFSVEKEAFSISEHIGYKKTALFLIAMLFDRLARRTDAREPQAGQAYLAICTKAIEALKINDWNDGVQTLEELVDMCWQSQLVH